MLVLRCVVSEEGRMDGVEIAISILVAYESLCKVIALALALALDRFEPLLVVLGVF